MSIHPFVLMEQCDIHQLDFLEISYLEILQKIISTVQFWLKFDKLDKQFT
jgi:hypothetical protein